VNLEAIGVGLSAATLIVIAATAIAAIIQLRHLRASNQLSALLEILDQWNKPHLQAAYARFLRDLPAKLADNDYRKRLESPQSQDRESHPEFLIFDLWEQVGTYAKYGLVDERILLDIVSAQVTNAWRLGWPVIEILRRRSGPATFENFEYLAVRATFFHKQFADGAYPKGMPRMDDLQRTDATTSPPA
jgi:hypothetical protein